MCVCVFVLAHTCMCTCALLVCYAGMGQTLSEPVTTKDTFKCENAQVKVGSSCMQGWRISILISTSVSYAFPVPVSAASPHQIPPRWPSGKDVRLQSGRSRVRILLVARFFRGRVIQMT